MDMKTRPLGEIEPQAWVDLHDDPLVLIDSQYTIIAANRAYAAAYGAEIASVVGRKCHSVSHRSDEPCHRHGEDCPHRTVFATGRPAEVVHVHFDHAGHPDKVRLSAQPLHSDGRVLFMAERIRRVPQQSRAAYADLVGLSPAFTTMMRELADAAGSDIAVLLGGETGAGKEMAARYLHHNGPQSRGPFVVVDCTAIPESLFEAELFGHSKGAFTGPSASRQGLVEAADSGTLFLDEIGDLPLAMQSKLLRFAESVEYRGLGSNQIRRSNCRIISASNKALRPLMAAGGFRSDLFFRLAGIEIWVPALRDRGGDASLIAQELLSSMSQGRLQLSATARAALDAQPFPGNVRELRNLMRRVAHRHEAGVLHSQDLGLGSLDAGRLPGRPVTEGPRMRLTEGPGDRLVDRPGDDSGRQSARSLAQQVRRLCGCGMTRREVARSLGVSERTVYRHLAGAPIAGQATGAATASEGPAPETGPTDV
ncbi:MAG: sigma-54-dependent Fis family transcriptional regulator [Burkholderiaceae bacterium]|nr:sigma-54-dependent Fis family transcriptional regulator [Burkholderiaceae bacterium]